MFHRLRFEVGMVVGSLKHPATALFCCSSGMAIEDVERWRTHSGLRIKSSSPHNVRSASLYWAFISSHTWSIKSYFRPLTIRFHTYSLAGSVRFCWFSRRFSPILQVQLPVQSNYAGSLAGSVRFCRFGHRFSLIPPVHSHSAGSVTSHTRY